MGNSSTKYTFSETHGIKIMRVYKNKTLLYTGEYYDRKKHGFGIEYHSNRKTKYFGTFHNGKYHGNGRLHRRDGSLCYEGCFKHGRPLYVHAYDYELLL